MRIGQKFIKFFCGLLLACGATAAHADDWGCEVLLCMSNPAGPTAVAQCVPPINRLWDHLKRGKPFPTCDTGGSARAVNQGVGASNCPPQYAIYYEGWVIGCKYMGVISVVIDNKVWANVWWTWGDTVGEYSPEAKAAGATSTRFEDDYKVWFEEQERLRKQREWAAQF